MMRYWAQYAWLGGEIGGTARDVVIDVDGDRFSAVSAGVSEPPADAMRLAGLTLPGFANVHSHAFHRALRGRTHAGRGTFWSWREQMYRLAQRLDPDSLYALARAVFAEMALAGVTSVGEFHYVHHDHNGTPYADPNEMGHRLIAAASESGVRLTLLDTLYLSSTVDGDELTGVQRRFGDITFDRFADRVRALGEGPGQRVGLAAHSVRAVPEPALAELAALTNQTHQCVHIHLSEQRAENEACRATYGRSPTELLHSVGLLGTDTTAVHATHLADIDRALLGDTGTGVCLCPTTERDLADGIGPARALADTGCVLSLGSDSHAVIDLLEEARALELDERLRDEHRGHFDADALLRAASTAGHTALGWPDAGVIAPGARADLVTLRLDTVRAAGFDPDQAAAAAVFAATAADVRQVIVDGRLIVQDGQHLLISNVAGELATAIGALWE